MNDQPYNSLPVGVSPAVLEVIQQEGKEWERRADKLEKDWEYEKRRADQLAERLEAIPIPIPAGVATRVVRRKDGPWEWPRVAYVMISDSLKVEGHLGSTARNGDPLQLAYAVNFIESLYRAGYVIAESSPAAPRPIANEPGRTVEGK